MSAKTRYALALAAFLVLALSFVVFPAVVLWVDLPVEQREVLTDILAPRAGIIIVLLALGLALFGAAFSSAYKAYAGAPLKVAEGLRIMGRANRSHRLEAFGPFEVRELVQATNDFADQHEALWGDLEDKVADAKMRVEEEKNRLAALMSELAQGVLVCNVDGRILLYNARARQVLVGSDKAGGGSASLFGLGRSIFTLLDRSLIVHALETIHSRLAAAESDLVIHFVTRTSAEHLVRVQMAPVLLAREPGSAAEAEASAVATGGDTRGTVTGFVLTVDDITRSFETDTRRDMLLQSLTEGSRASLANIRAAVEMLLDYQDIEAEQRDRFVKVIGDEARALSARLDDTMNQYADSLKTRWPLEEMLGIDVVEAARKRIDTRVHLPTKTEEVDTSVWIKVDSYALIQALTYLASRLQDEYDIRELRFGLSQEGRLAQLDLIWSGAVISSQTIYSWEIDPMRAGGEDSPLSLRDVVERHGAEIVLKVEKARHRSYFRILLPLASAAGRVPAAALVHTEGRPEYYDFDLFHQAGQTRELDERRLTDLAYTVFDTETTGLNPSEGDEIIQIGAVRILNGRLLRQEAYEQLIDPKRMLPRESVKIHGITEDMLLGQPAIDKVLPVFHAYCEDTVLIAHNAAFDMRFLQLKEASTGLRFTQPVLDTLMLSAVIHPNQESHRLEHIAERFGINVVGRHTALGDAIVTGEVFLRMVPLLAEKGIHTLREAREAAEKTYYARLKY